MRARATLSVVLICLGALVAPVAVTAKWVSWDLADTDTFVDALAPLADDAEVQDFIAGQVVEAVDQRLDVPSLTSRVFDSVPGLGSASPAVRRPLEEFAVNGVNNAIENGMAALLASDSFATVWEQSLRAGHRTAVRALEGDPDGLVTLGDDGGVGIQLGPVVEALKARLVARDVPFADSIPAVDKTVVVAESDAVRQLRTGFQLVVGLGLWLPWAALVLFAAAILVSRRRIVAVVRVGIATALTCGIVLLVLSIVKAAIAGSVSLPPAVVDGMVGALTEPLAIALGTTAVLSAAIASVAGISLRLDVLSRASEKGD